MQAFKRLTDVHRERRSRPRPEKYSADSPQVHCSLWVHDDTFSADNIIFNDSLWPSGTMSSGSVAVIIPKMSSATNDESGAHTDQREAYEKATPARARNASGISNGQAREYSSAQGENQPHGTSRDGITYEAGTIDYLVFIPRNMTAEQKAKTPNLQVDFKHREHVSGACSLMNAIGFSLQKTGKSFRL